jgi:multicomponent Na+:H+ antiporter subunit C
MEIHIAVLIGILYAASIYLVLRRSLVKLVFGLALLGHASNLLLLAIGRLTRGRPPIIAEDQIVLSGHYADPLPQALILTAIVIGFGVQAFAIILIKNVYAAVGSDDLEHIDSTDTLD